MSRLMKGMFTQEFLAKSGYKYLAGDVIESVIKDWKVGRFDAIGWLQSDQSCLWCDYLDINRDWLLRMLKELT